MMQVNGDVEPKYMSKQSWQMCSGGSGLLGLILIIVCLAVGGCSCDDLCKEVACASYAGGCEKGSFNAYECARVMVYGSNCNDPNGYCKTGGMSGGAWIFLLIVGIICFIASCVRCCCGCMACCCFARSRCLCRFAGCCSRRCRRRPGPAEVQHRGQP